MSLTRWAEHAHDTEGLATWWHLAHAAVAACALLLAAGELSYHLWATRQHWRAWR